MKGGPCPVHAQYTWPVRPRMGGAVHMSIHDNSRRERKAADEMYVCMYVHTYNIRTHDDVLYDSFAASCIGDPSCSFAVAGPSRYRTVYQNLHPGCD